MSLPAHKVCASPCLEYCICGSHILKKDEFSLEFKARLIGREQRGEFILQKRLGVLSEQRQELLSLGAVSDKDMGVQKELFELEDNAG